jgi:hypothetical protein
MGGSKVNTVLSLTGLSLVFAALVVALAGAGAEAHATSYADDDGYAGGANQPSFYDMTVSAQQIEVGESVTVDWSGHYTHDDWESWDWVAPYLATACNGTDNVGQNTCYATNRWEWVSEQGGASSGSWSLSLSTPGKFQFRVSYCWCCHGGQGDFDECDHCELLPGPP